MEIQEWQTAVHQLARTKGWYDQPRSLGDMMTNIHSELSEAWEEYRTRAVTDTYYEEGGKPCGFLVELADAVIRIMDMCEYLGLDLEEAIQLKHEYNKNRSYRHGGKRA